MIFRRMTLSLRSQFMLVFVTFAFLLTTVLGGVAYRASRNTIRNAAVRSVGNTADARRAALLRLLRKRHERADNVLQAAPIICGIGEATRTECLVKFLQEVIGAEDGLAARFLSPGLSPILVGDTELAAMTLPPPRAHQLVQFGSDARGRGYYAVQARAEADTTTLTLFFDTQSIDAIFSQSGELGESGEAILIDAAGSFLTPSKYSDHPDALSPTLSPPLRLCLEGKGGEMLAPDYRNVGVIHGFRPMPEIGDGCAMAHIDQSEAFAPAHSLGNTLIGFSALSAAIAMALAFFLARMLAQPIDQLTSAVRAIQAGDFDRAVAVEGPFELQTFAQAFSEMARA